MSRYYENDAVTSGRVAGNSENLPGNISSSHLAAQIEQFDSFWEAPEDIEKGYKKFQTFYRHNYLKYLPKDRGARILVISCGAGYLVDLLVQEGYSEVIGIDSDPSKIEYATLRNLNCKSERAFEYLLNNPSEFDVIFCEQEVNHLTKEEILEFLRLCWLRLSPGGVLIVHSLNGANPITGSEALAQNFDHYNTFTEYSLRQVLTHSGFDRIKVIPLRLYVFYLNPLNYILLAIDGFLNFVFRISFMFYGKSNKIFSKKIAAIGRKAPRRTN